MVTEHASDNEAWHIIPCPKGILLSSVSKERGTHGSIYTLWECERRTPVWIGQSIPALVKAINDAVRTPEKRLHASSLYRCLRREARKENHKSFRVEKWQRSQIEDLNAHIALFPSAVYVSKSPELWSCGKSSSDERENDEPPPGVS